MDKKKRILVGSSVALLALGLMIAVNATVNATDTGKQGKMGFGRGSWMQGGPHQIQGYMGKRTGNLTFLENLGLPENATGEQAREALWDEKLKDLGLTQDSTLREYRQALDARMQAMQNERATKLKEKLGLSENVTNEEVMAAMKNWQHDNKELIGGLRHRPRGSFGAIPEGRFPPMSS